MKSQYKNIFVFLALLLALWGRPLYGDTSQAIQQGLAANTQDSLSSNTVQTSQTQNGLPAADTQSSPSANSQFGQTMQMPASLSNGDLLAYNIFDPERTSVRNSETPVKLPEADHIVLVGALLLNNECVAFFQGNRSDFCGKFGIGSKIADLEIKKIDTERVQISDGNQSIDLEIGQGLSRAGSNAWAVSNETLTIASTPNASETTPTATVQAGAVATPAKESEPQGSNSSEDEILKKMMERRKQETQ